MASIAADRDEARAEVARLQRAVAEMEAGRADREAAVVETKEVAGTSEEVGRLTRQVAALEAQLRVSAARAAEGAGPAAGAGPVDVPDALRLAAGSDLSGTATRELHALLEEASVVRRCSLSRWARLTKLWPPHTTLLWSCSAGPAQS